jgi:N-acetylglucosaminyl-diphospho-decaprenol L-rhamnosyltransferase
MRFWKSTTGLDVPDRGSAFFPRWRFRGKGILCLSGSLLHRPMPREECPVVPVDIAFVTVNFNTREYVRQLAGFFKSLDVPFTFSFTVVDNGSKDGSREFLQSDPEIHSLQTGGNLGYGRAINRGVTATDSKYVCVMNTDVILNREALIGLWRFLEGRPDAGICAPRITYEDGRDQGMVFRRSLFSHYAHWFAKAQARYAKRKIANASVPLRVDGVLGAFFLIRRSAIPQPAFFDEDFFFFYEDTALAHTLVNRGVPCFVIPDATIIHIGGKSRSSDAVSLFYDSKYLYLKKFHGPFHARAIHFLDRARILRKWSLYSLVSLVTASERVKSKRRHYKIAWESARLR